MGPRQSTERTPRPTALVVHDWRGRIEAEYRSAAIAQETVLWLIRIGASPDLVRAGNRIVDDELVHAEMSRAVWTAAGNTSAPPNAVTRPRWSITICVANWRSSPESWLT